MTTRDPRTDPQKGDVVIDRHGFHWQVMARDGVNVRVKIDYARRGDWWTLERWTMFATINEIIHTAPPPRVMDPNNPKGKRRQLTPKRER